MKQIILYRGGKCYNRYFSTSKKVARAYLENRGGSIKKYILPADIKIINYCEIPGIKYNGINDYNIEKYSGGKDILEFMNNELEEDYAWAEKWAKDHGYDAIKYSTEGEIRIINEQKCGYII